MRDELLNELYRYRDFGSFAELVEMQNDAKNAEIYRMELMKERKRMADFAARDKAEQIRRVIKNKRESFLCPACGADVSNRFCPYCGQRLDYSKDCEDNFW